MNVALVFAITILVLFGLAFMTKRRFGVLGLALAAGSMLSELWAEALTPIVAQTGVRVDVPPLITIVTAALVLLPALLLLFSGPSYRETTPRVVGASLFALLAFALLIEPLGSALILQDQGKQIYDFVAANQVYIVTAGLVFALVDILAMRTSKHHPRSHRD